MQHSVFPINSLPSCRMVDQGIDELVHDPDIKTRAAELYYGLVDADVIFYFSDIAIQAEAMGAKVTYSRTGMPAVSSPAEAVNVPRASDVSRMRANAQVVSSLAVSFPERFRAALIYGPFTVAGQVVGEETLMRETASRPQEAEKILEQSFECARSYADLLIEAGANLVWVSDPLAALIAPEDFQKFAGSYLRRLFEHYSGLPGILHICGDTSSIISHMASTGVTGISFDNCMNLLGIEDYVPEDTLIIGNLDPVEVVSQGDPAGIAASTRDLAAVMGIKDNFALSTGCAVPPSAPVENVQSFMHAGRKALEELGPFSSHLAKLQQAVYQGLTQETQQLVQEAGNAGIPALTTIRSGLTRAVRKASACYEAGRCHLPSLLLKVDAFYKGFNMLENHDQQSNGSQPLVLLGTVKGDTHDIGKNLVRIFLQTNGYDVLDLGVNVSAQEFLDAFLADGPVLIGLSAFTSSSKNQLQQIIKTFRDSGYTEIPIIVGGAAVNAEVARRAGADGYGRDAVRAVELANRLVAKSLAKA